MKASEIKFSKRDKKREKHKLDERRFRRFVEEQPSCIGRESYKRPHRTMHDWLSEADED